MTMTMKEKLENTPCGVGDLHKHCQGDKCGLWNKRHKKCTQAALTSACDDLVDHIAGGCQEFGTYSLTNGLQKSIGNVVEAIQEMAVSISEVGSQIGLAAITEKRVTTVHKRDPDAALKTPEKDDTEFESE